MGYRTFTVVGGEDVGKNLNLLELISVTDFEPEELEKVLDLHPGETVEFESWLSKTESLFITREVK